MWFSAEKPVSLSGRCVLRRLYSNAPCFYSLYFHEQNCSLTEIIVQPSRCLIHDQALTIWTVHCTNVTYHSFTSQARRLHPHQNTASIKLKTTNFKPLSVQIPSNPVKTRQIHQKLIKNPSNPIKTHQNPSKLIKTHQNPSKTRVFRFKNPFSVFLYRRIIKNFYHVRTIFWHKIWRGVVLHLLNRLKRFNLLERDKILGFGFLAGQTDIPLRWQNFLREPMKVAEISGVLFASWSNKSKCGKKCDEFKSLYQNILKLLFCGHISLLQRKTTPLQIPPHMGKRFAIWRRSRIGSALVRVRQPFARNVRPWQHIFSTVQGSNTIVNSSPNAKCNGEQFKMLKIFCVS